MRFEEEPTPEIEEEYHVLEDYFNNVKMTPWTQNRPESQKIHGRAIKEYN